MAYSMPWFSRIINEILIVIHAMEKSYFVKPIIHCQITCFSIRVKSGNFGPVGFSAPLSVLWAL